MKKRANFKIKKFLQAIQSFLYCLYSRKNILACIRGVDFEYLNVLRKFTDSIICTYLLFMLLEIFATTEKIFIEVAKNVIWVNDTAAESADVGHLMDLPGPRGRYITAPSSAVSICLPCLEFLKLDSNSSCFLTLANNFFRNSFNSLTLIAKLDLSIKIRIRGRMNLISNCTVESTARKS